MHAIVIMLVVEHQHTLIAVNIGVGEPLFLLYQCLLPNPVRDVCIAACASRVPDCPTTL
jgi:hypothetical protein